MTVVWFAFVGIMLRACGSLVLTSSLLTSLQLLEVEVTDLHVTVVLSETSGEVSGVNVTSNTLLLSWGSGLFHWSWGGGATEHRCDTSTNCVTDSRTDSDTGSGGSHVSEETWLLWLLGLWVRVGVWLRWWSSGSGVSGSLLDWSRALDCWTGTTGSSGHCEYS